MSVSNFTFESMQKDHQHWLAAHAKWERDIERWQAEQRSAVSRLNAIQKLVAEDGENLEDHLRALKEVKDAIEAHDRKIATYETGVSAELEDFIATRHSEKEGDLGRQEDVHERIGENHKQLMEQLRKLESPRNVTK